MFNPNRLLDVENALSEDPISLCEAKMYLFKETDADSLDAWKFAGIASDESEDEDGDKILKKSLDLSYAQKRGYVNWHHSRAPADQIGYLTKAVIVTNKNKDVIQQGLEIPVSDSASVYVEGELYKHVDRAIEVHNIMKSQGAGAPGLGLSLDGMVARDIESNGVVKAYVRGVAVTPIPAHPNTLSRLKKSLQGYAMLKEAGFAPADLPAAIAKEVVEAMKKSADEAMSADEATLWLLRQRPHWTYDLASKVVQFTLSKRTGEVI